MIATEERFNWTAMSAVGAMTENKKIIIVCSSCCQKRKCGNLPLHFWWLQRTARNYSKVRAARATRLLSTYKIFNLWRCRCRCSTSYYRKIKLLSQFLSVLSGFHVEENGNDAQLKLCRMCGNFSPIFNQYYDCSVASSILSTLLSKLPNYFKIFA